MCGNPYNNDPQRGENSSKFAPLLVVETPSHRAAMERLLGMICIERIGMVRPAGWSGGGASPPVLPSRRGCIIGRQMGVTFESKLTRVCGEQRLAKKKASDDSGSSPRVRGTDRPNHQAIPPCRFIPACAGNSKPVSNGTRLHPVHPRVCGEQFSPVLTTEWETGSSPRVRGTATG